MIPEVDVGENPPNQDELTVVVTKRCSMHRVDKRVSPDGTNKGPSSKKRKKSHQTDEPLVRLVKGSNAIWTLMSMVSLIISFNKTPFIFDLHLLFLNFK